MSESVESGVVTGDVTSVANDASQKSAAEDTSNEVSMFTAHIKCFTPVVGNAKGVIVLAGSVSVCVSLS